MSGAVQNAWLASLGSKVSTSTLETRSDGTIENSWLACCEGQRPTSLFPSCGDGDDAIYAEDFDLIGGMQEARFRNGVAGDDESSESDESDESDSDALAPPPGALLVPRSLLTALALAPGPRDDDLALRWRGAGALVAIELVFEREDTFFAPLRTPAPPPMYSYESVKGGEGGGGSAVPAVATELSEIYIPARARAVDRLQLIMAVVEVG